MLPAAKLWSDRARCLISEEQGQVIAKGSRYIYLEAILLMAFGEQHRSKSVVEATRPDKDEFTSSEIQSKLEPKFGIWEIDVKGPLLDQEPESCRSCHGSCRGCN